VLKKLKRELQPDGDACCRRLAALFAWILANKSGSKRNRMVNTFCRAFVSPLVQEVPEFERFCFAVSIPAVSAAL
jgi:hypothetical protein